MAGRGEGSIGMAIADGMTCYRVAVVWMSFEFTVGVTQEDIAQCCESQH
ncbi:MAG: hypothetical protein G01um101420_242 [Parcubacteria group bacterium Gr01-1014_20]|nr:MAG: hypothetical protein G01um101420_242 [Parcubacteria group bacterium Gr01-1014_20]